MTEPRTCPDDRRGAPERSPERSPLGTFAECPHCAGRLRPEHAHYRCSQCGWRDSCCD